MRACARHDGCISISQQIYFVWHENWQVPPHMNMKQTQIVFPLFPSRPLCSGLRCFSSSSLFFFLLHFCVQWADGCFVCLFVCFRNKVRRGPVHSNTPSREKWLKCDIIKKKNLKQILYFCFSDLLCSLYYYTISHGLYRIGKNKTQLPPFLDDFILMWQNMLCRFVFKGFLFVSFYLSFHTHILHTFSVLYNVTKNNLFIHSFIQNQIQVW